MVFSFQMLLLERLICLIFLWKKVEIVYENELSLHVNVRETIGKAV